MYLCPFKPCCYVYAYFDDYVLCFRNWIWAVFAFSLLWHLIKRNCESDESLDYPFIIDLSLFS